MSNKCREWLTKFVIFALCFVLNAGSSVGAVDKIAGQPVDELQSGQFNAKKNVSVAEPDISNGRMGVAGNHDQSLLLASDVVPGKHKGPPDIWASPADDKTGPSWGWMSPVGGNVLARQKTLYDDPEYLKFIGADGQPCLGADPRFSKEVYELLCGSNVDFSLPKKEDGKPRCYVDVDSSNALLAGDPFEQLMIHAVDPSSQRKSSNPNPYCVLTASYESRLKSAVMNSSGNLTPAALLGMGLQICGNNYPLAVLTVHNLLKDVTYQGRQWRDKLAALVAGGRSFKFPADLGEFAGKLVTMRAAPGDKMGIYYHAFVQLAIAAWTDDPDAADKAISQEYLVRTLAQYVPALNMGSPPDDEKKGSDLLFARAAHIIYFCMPKKVPAIVVCSACVQPEKGRERTEFKLALKHQLQGKFAGNPSVHRDIDVTGAARADVDHSTNVESAGAHPLTVNQEFTYLALKAGKYDFEYALNAPDVPKVALGKVPFEVSRELFNPPRGKQVYFCFQKGDLFDQYTLREVTPAEDNSFWSGPGDDGKTRRDSQLAGEAGIYGSSFSRVPAGTDVNGYNIGANLPTSRQNCGGFAMARLLRAPYQFPTPSAYEFVRKFGELMPRKQAKPNDAVVFYRASNDPQHFALVESFSNFSYDSSVFSKDDQECVRHGAARDYVAAKRSAVGVTAAYDHFHLEWNQIRAYRRGEVTVKVLSADPKHKVDGALVELMASEPVGEPPRAVWSGKKVDASGRAAFTGFDKYSGQSFPFDVSKYNLKVRVTCPGFKTAEYTQNSGARFPVDRPLEVTVYLKPEPAQEAPPAVKSLQFKRSAPRISLESLYTFDQHSIFAEYAPGGSEIRFYWGATDGPKVPCSTLTFTNPPEIVTSGMEVPLRLSCAPIDAHGDAGARYEISFTGFGMNGHWTGFKPGDYRLSRHDKTFVGVNRYPGDPTSNQCTLMVDCLPPNIYPWNGKMGPHKPEPFTLNLAADGGHGKINIEWTYTPVAPAP